MTTSSEQSASSPDLAGALRAAMITMVVLLLSGLGMRALDRRLAVADAEPIRLENPLSILPLELGTWKGREISMDQRVLDVAGCDDYVYRYYTDEQTGETIDLYVAYAARPAKMLSHRPQVCYPAHGWSPTGQRPDRFTLPDGTTRDCLIHSFMKPQPDRESVVVVLNYYIVRGRHLTEWTDFWGPKWRLPNLSRDPNFYVAQVQVVATARDAVSLSQAEETVKRFAAAVASLVEGLLPQPEDRQVPNGGPVADLLCVRRGVS